MSARTHKVKIGDIFTDVMRTEPGRLRQHRLNREGAAEVAVQCILKVQRVDSTFRDDMLREVRQITLLKIPDNHIAVRLRHRPPVYSATEMRYWRQHIPGVTALWCQRGISCCWTMQVKREILRQYL